MKARNHTDAMLQWWSRAGINRVDLAIRRHDKTMIWHDEVSLSILALPWARSENARKADVYIRPARNRSWPVVFLDDVQTPTADRIPRKYDCLVVHTSPEGGCHVWLRCDQPLNEHDRHLAQLWLTQKIDADPASTSGEHLGRLAGFKNWKRNTWVNVRHSVLTQRGWTPRLSDNPPERDRHPTDSYAHGKRDTSQSGREWAWTCRMLEAGCSPSIVYHGLVHLARPRRRADAERYCKRTINRAIAHVCHEQRSAIRSTTRDIRHTDLTR